MTRINRKTRERGQGQEQGHPAETGRGQKVHLPQGKGGGIVQINRRGKQTGLMGVTAPRNLKDSKCQILKGFWVIRKRIKCDRRVIL